MDLIAAETMHFIGCLMLVGVILLIDLRVLGFMKQVSFSALDRLLPWAMLGFALNVFTGMLFFAAAYGQHTNNPGVLLEADLRAAGRREHALLHSITRGRSSGDAMPMLSKAAAVSAMFFWVGVMYWGSMLPFIGNAF